MYLPRTDRHALHTHLSSAQGETWRVSIRYDVMHSIAIPGRPLRSGYRVGHLDVGRGLYRNTPNATFVKMVEHSVTVPLSLPPD